MAKKIHKYTVVVQVTLDVRADALSPKLKREVEESCASAPLDMASVGLNGWYHISRSHAEIVKFEPK